MSSDEQRKLGAIHVAEIPFESGQVQFQYARYLSADGSHWIRHGPFLQYHENGQLASEGTFDHGLELGPWRDFHANGQIAAEGEYLYGKEHGVWRYWSPEGAQEKEVLYVLGTESSAS
jgi:antitoxin component YwqK of YwqJK toxin-antitoxin module